MIGDKIIDIEIKVPGKMIVGHTHIFGDTFELKSATLISPKEDVRLYIKHVSINGKVLVSNVNVSAINFLKHFIDRVGKIGKGSVLFIELESKTVKDVIFKCRLNGN